MTILSESDPSPEFFEERLIISLLEKENLTVNELKGRLRKSQQNHPDPIFSGKYHSWRNYDYWIQKLEGRGIVQELDNKLSLTKLGRWISSSEVGDFFKRNCFLSVFICGKCSKQSHIVLFSPLLNTIDTNRINIKGEIFVDLKCPRCGIISSQVHLWPKEELIHLYNSVVQELQQFVNLEAQKCEMI